MSVSTTSANSSDFVQACSEAKRRADQARVPILVSFTVDCEPSDPLEVFATSAPSYPRILFTKPTATHALVGIGSVTTLIGKAGERFGQIASSWRELRANAITTGATPIRGSGNTLLGGFSFNPLTHCSEEWRQFPAGLFVLPEVLLTLSGKEAQVTVNHMCAPGSDILHSAQQMQAALTRIHITNQLCTSTNCPPDEPIAVHEHCLADGLSIEQGAPAAWKNSVAATTQRIRTGDVEKVVLARAVHVSSPQPFHPERLLRYLTDTYPNCYVFAFDQGESCFLGATPEQLVSIDNGIAHAMCLAGSAPRGADPDADAKYGQSLLTSTKDRREHQIVVRELTSNLSKVCSDVSTPEEPGLLRLPNVQHLHTPVSARILPGHSILDVVEQLHPTPAVGGFPRDAAFAEIAAQEPTDRGWYAGPIGWVDGNGAGEFAVAIRSALIRGQKATLYAGCGIVADSDPEAEYEESCLKLRPMLAALEADQRCQRCQR